MSAPTKPVRIGQLERPTIGEAGTASLTALPDGRRLLVVGRKGDQILDVYSTKGDDLAFTLGATWGVSGDGVKTKLPDKDDNFGDYQNLNFVTGCDGTQYLLGTHREGTLVGSDYADLFTFAWAGGSAKPVITKVAKRHLSCSVSGKDQCNLDAAAGSYVTPDGALRLYAAEHDNDGPSGSIKMKEF